MQQKIHAKRRTDTKNGEILHETEKQTDRDAIIQITAGIELDNTTQIPENRRKLQHMRKESLPRKSLE